jgi:NADH-ubiquinone oxidoreductase chain 2
MIAILILLLAVTSGLERNSNYIENYVKLNRIVFIIFILSTYLAFNTLDVKVLGSGIGIYGGVFKVTVLSQVFDIIMLMIGGIVSLLTCFIPYNLKKKENLEVLSELEKGCLENKSISESNFSNSFIIEYLIKFLPNIKLNTPYFLEKRFDYNRLEVKEYSFLLLFTVFGGSLLISSQNLISLYLSLELQSFSLYILSTSQIGSFRGTSAGLKYFLLGGLSSGLIILGCSLLYAYTGTLNIEHIFIMYSDNFTNNFIDPCLIVLFAGLLFKISAAPFHNWAPDVYSDVSTNSTTWLIIIAKLSVLILMFLLIHNIYVGINLNSLNMWEQYCSIYDINYNIFNLDNNNIKNNYIVSLDKYINKSVDSLYLINSIQSFSLWNPSYSSLGLWTNLLTLSALISLIIGTVLGISQSRIKRLFAYSTIAHVGFLLLGLSLNSVGSLDAFIFYLIQYSLTNLNLFFILIMWGYLYYAYYLDNNILNVYYLKSNLWKDDYVKLGINKDLELLFNYYYKYNSKDNKNNSRILNTDSTFNYYPNEKKNTISILQKYLITHRDNNFYDFSNDNKEWLFTPVPFLTHFKGMHIRDPFLAFCLSVTVFSLAGIPPLIGFFAKQQILLASMQLDYYFISVIIIFTSVIGAAYYLRIIKFIYFYDDVYDSILYNKSKFVTYFDNQEYYSLYIPSNNLSLVIALLSNIILFYILKPYLLINVIYMITIPLFQY